MLLSLRGSACSSVDAPSSSRSGDRVEEDLLMQSIYSEGDQTQFLWTPSSRVTGLAETSSFSEFPSRHRFGVGALEHQILMRRRSREP